MFRMFLKFNRNDEVFLSLSQMLSESKAWQRFAQGLSVIATANNHILMNASDARRSAMQEDEL